MLFALRTFLENAQKTIRKQVFMLFAMLLFSPQCYAVLYGYTVGPDSAQGFGELNIMFDLMPPNCAAGCTETDIADLMISYTGGNNAPVFDTQTSEFTAEVVSFMASDGIGSVLEILGLSASVVQLISGTGFQYGDTDYTEFGGSGEHTVNVLSAGTDALAGPQAIAAPKILILSTPSSLWLMLLPIVLLSVIWQTTESSCLRLNTKYWQEYWGK